MATTTCYFRTLLLFTDSLKPDTGNTGHFDLQINTPSFSLETATYGSGSDVKTMRTYHYPILSYGLEGYVTVYDSKNYTLEDKQMLCKYKFAGENDGIGEIIKALQRLCEFDANKSKDNIDKYKVTSGRFQTYSTEKNNCFAALAEWCNMLGYTAPMSIYNKYTYPNGKFDSNGYKNYTAWPIFHKYHHLWIFDDLKV